MTDPLSGVDFTPGPYSRPAPPPYGAPTPLIKRPQLTPDRTGAPPGGIMHPSPVRGVRRRAQVVVVWISVADMAEMMNVSKMTIYRLIHSGEIPSTRVGRSFRVQEAHFARYLRENTTGVE